MMHSRLHQNLIGNWQGKVSGNRVITATFSPDGRVQFIGEQGKWEISNWNNNDLHATLNMLFIRGEERKTFIATNSFALSKDNNELIIQSERGTLFLKRHNDTPSPTISSPLEHTKQFLESTKESIGPISPLPKPLLYIYNTLTAEMGQNSQEYNDDYHGIHFLTPPNHQYVVKDHVVNIKSPKSPTAIIARMHRPHPEHVIRARYRAGYSEGALRFIPTFQDLMEVPELCDPSKNMIKVYYGEYIESAGKIIGRLISFGTAYGDCLVVFGVTEAVEVHEKALINTLYALARTVSFTPPRAPSPYDSLPGQFMMENSRNGEYLILFRDMKFYWGRQSDVEGNLGPDRSDRYGEGTWDRIGSCLEGEFILRYTDGRQRRARFVVLNKDLNMYTVDEQTCKHYS